MIKYRILEREYGNGDIKYVLEKYSEVTGEWTSVFRHADLEVIRDAKQRRESQPEDRELKREKVIE